jgi:hypothetical protein
LGYERFGLPSSANNIGLDRSDTDLGMKVKTGLRIALAQDRDRGRELLVRRCLTPQSAGASDQIRLADRSFGCLRARGQFGWHVPLYRQSKMLACQGIDLDRSTLAFRVGHAAAELMPPYGRLKANLLTSAKLVVDATVPMLDPGRGQKKGWATSGRWCVMTGPGAGTDPPAVVYTYAPQRAPREAAGELVAHRLEAV